MADGFEENAEFFTLTYEAPLRVASHREFPKIAPLLWMRAGSRGRRIDDISGGWDVADTYGVLADLDKHPTSSTLAAPTRTSTSSTSSPTRTACSSRSRRTARAHRARAPLRVVPPQLRDRVGPRCAVKFTLKDYQADAVEDVLANLKRARDAFKRQG
jgi:hypothetical protein